MAFSGNRNIDQLPHIRRARSLVDREMRSRFISKTCWAILEQVSRKTGESPELVAGVFGAHSHLRERSFFSQRMAVPERRSFHQPPT